MARRTFCIDSKFFVANFNLKLKFPVAKPVKIYCWGLYNPIFVNSNYITFSTFFQIYEFYLDFSIRS